MYIFLLNLRKSKTRAKIFAVPKNPTLKIECNQIEKIIIFVIQF